MTVMDTKRARSKCIARPTAQMTDCFKLWAHRKCETPLHFWQEPDTSIVDVDRNSTGPETFSSGTRRLGVCVNMHEQRHGYISTRGRRP